MTKLEKWALVMFIIGIVYLPNADSNTIILVDGLMSVIGGTIFVNAGNNK